MGIASVFGAGKEPDPVPKPTSAQSPATGPQPIPAAVPPTLGATEPGLSPEATPFSTGRFDRLLNGKKPSSYQDSFFAAVESSKDRHVILDSRAGTGKTSTLVGGTNIAVAAL